MAASALGKADSEHSLARSKICSAPSLDGGRQLHVEEVNAVDCFCAESWKRPQIEACSCDDNRESREPEIEVRCRVPRANSNESGITFRGLAGSSDCCYG